MKLGSYERFNALMGSPKTAYIFALAIVLSTLIPSVSHANDQPTGSTSTSSDPEIQAPQAPVFQQFNMCDLVCDDEIPNRLNPADLVIWFATIDTPQFIALNEACSSTVNDLVNALEGYSFAFATARFTQTSDNRACPLDPDGMRRYGNAIFGLSPQTGGPLFTPYNSQIPQNPPCAPGANPDGGNECRVATCMQIESFLQDRVGCSSHLASQSEAIATNQSAEFYNMATAYADPISIFYLGGDFNLFIDNIHSTVTQNCTSDSKMSVFTHSLLDAALTRKIDYIFFCSGSALPPPELPLPRPPHCDAYYSDHCYVFSTMAEHTFAERTMPDNSDSD